MSALAFLTDPAFAGFLAAAMRLAIPIMLAALGGLFAERSGVLNIGLEGSMLMGAFVGFVAAYTTGSVAAGVLLSVAAGIACGLILGVYTITLGASQVVVGIAMNLLATGVTAFFYRLIFGQGTQSPRVDTFQPLDLGALADIPLVGPLLFRHDLMVYVALALVAVAWVVIGRTRFGLNIRAVGEHPEAAETLGVDVFHVRYLAVAISGGLAGLGGAFLSLSATGIFIDNMTAGRGYIALAIVILGRRHPFGVLFAALLFGAADALQLRAQLLPTGVPFQFLLMLPYVLTIIVLAGSVGRVGAPAALGVPIPARTIRGKLNMLDLHAATSPEVEESIARGAVAVLAVGALEQHGAHLPLSTDTVMSQGVARRIAQSIGGLLLPPIAYGDAWNNEGFAGTLSLSPDTMRAILLDIGRGLRRIGVKALIIVNGHFGNREPIALAARTLKTEFDFPVMHLDYPGMERIASAICESKAAAPTFYHADEVETSMMLALAPELVRMERAAPEYPIFPETFGMEPMRLDTFNRSGVFGDPRPATAEKGERLVAGIVEESTRLVQLWLEKVGCSPTSPAS